MANTAWNPSDKTTNVTLTNSNLTATTSGGGANFGVRGVLGLSTGKHYFEVTMGWLVGNDEIGLGTSAALFTTTTLGTCTLAFSGAVALNNSATSVPTFTGLAPGNVIGIAVDFDNTLIWFRVTPSGNWNNTAGFTPGGTGGVNFSSIVGGGLPLYPYAFFASFSYAYTANFGDTPFVGAVPAGFTAGFPGPLSPVTGTLAITQGNHTLTATGVITSPPVYVPCPSGFNALPVPSGPNRPEGAVYGVSADGRTAVGFATDDSATVDNYRQACYWAGVSAPYFIAPRGTSAVACSADGSVIVGARDTGDPGTGTLFWWSASAGLVHFGASYDGVYDISGDASRIVGQTDITGTGAGIAHPCYWDRGTLAKTVLTLPSGYNGGTANGVSADGSAIVGVFYHMSGAQTAFRWTVATGMVDLGVPAGSIQTSSEAWDVSDDGNVIAGILRGPGSSTSFKWTPTDGMVEISWEEIYGITNVSGDGHTLYGYGWWPDSDTDSGSHIAFMKDDVVTTPVPTLFPPDHISEYDPNPSCISRDGLVLGGFAFAGGGGAASVPFLYCIHDAPAAKLALDNVQVDQATPEVLDLVYRWRSRQFYQQGPISLGACQISLDEAVSIPPPNAAIAPALNNGDPSVVLPVGVNALFRLYVGPDGDQLHMEKVLDQERMIFRLPSGLKAFNWQFEVISRVAIHSVELASTMRELRKV